MHSKKLLIILIQIYSLREPRRVKIVSKYDYHFHFNIGAFGNIVITQPLNILSEDLTINNLTQLLDHLIKLDALKPKSIIIIHGTDRLCLSASFIALTFNRPYPILFFGCQRSLDRPTSEFSLKFEISLKILSQLKNKVWILNQKTSDIYEILNPKFSVKLHSYNKNCFYSKTDKPEFSYNIVTNKFTLCSKQKHETHNFLNLFF